jgi:hypothetical protein
MNHTRVISSDLCSVGYDLASATLEVTFHSGGTYQYYGVPQSIFDALMAAPSKGKYLHRHIKHRYQYRHVR